MPANLQKPANVSGVDVSKAAARLPRMPGSVNSGGPAVGLPVLHEVNQTDGPGEEDSIFRVAVDLLDDSPYQPRIKYDEDELSD